MKREERELRRRIMQNVGHLAVAQIRKRAYKAARDAGLDSNTADAVSHRVTERMTPHCDLDELIQRVITEHAQP